VAVVVEELNMGGGTSHLHGREGLKVRIRQIQSLKDEHAVCKWVILTLKAILIVIFRRWRKLAMLRFLVTRKASRRSKSP
jgi:hypothetical protein